MIKTKISKKSGFQAFLQSRCYDHFNLSIAMLHSQFFFYLFASIFSDMISFQVAVVCFYFLGALSHLCVFLSQMVPWEDNAGSSGAVALPS